MAAMKIGSGHEFVVVARDTQGKAPPLYLTADRGWSQRPEEAKQHLRGADAYRVAGRTKAPEGCAVTAEGTIAQPSGTPTDPTEAERQP